jgi:hypothetical protein
MKSMLTVNEVAESIRAGRKLLLAGDEHLLSALPQGDWIGGTTPYFMTEDGGLCSHERLLATVLPESVERVRVRFYDAGELKRIPEDYPQNGFTYLVLPAFTDVHTAFAKDCSSWPDVFNQPLVGWVAGFDLKAGAAVRPKVFNGQSGEMSDTRAVAMQIELHGGLYARVNIANLFRAGSGDALTFPECSFEVSECFINGQKSNFAAYLKENGVDLHRPMVANYCGAMINVGINKIDEATGKVLLFAPVFPHVRYRAAEPVEDYETEFHRLYRLGHGSEINPIFSCNCISNYLYAGLEGKRTGNLIGPVTFGEIAYMLLNQTLVYLTLEAK